MGLWCCCWRNWNIFDLARNQKKMERKKEKTWRLIFPLPNVCKVHKQTQRLCFTAAFSSSCYWQYIFISLRSWVLDSQDSIVWSGRRKNKHGGCSSFWKCFHHVDIFCATWLCFTRKSSPMNRTQHVQTALRNVCHLFQVRTVEKQTEVYSRDPVCLAKHSLSCTTQNSSTFLLSPPSPVFSLSLLSPFCTLLPEKQVEQLPEACVQGGYPWLSHFNRLFSVRRRRVVNLQEPART